LGGEFLRRRSYLTARPLVVGSVVFIVITRLHLCDHLERTMESILYASRRLRRSKPGVELRLIPRKRGRANSLLPGAALRIAETVGFQFLSLRRDGLQNGSADRHQRSEIATTSTSPEQPVVLKTHVSAKLWTPRCQCRARIRCNSTIFWIGPRRELEELSPTNSIWREGGRSIR
jgi:hypothetical protein